MNLYFRSKGHADKDWVGSPSLLSSGPNQIDSAMKQIRTYLETMLRPGGSECIHTFSVSIDPIQLNPNYFSDLEAAGYEIRNNKIKRIPTPIPPTEDN
jgi:hypothetical protein